MDRHNSTERHIALTIPEIAEHIIELLGNDSSGLKSCSLVCREWANLAAPHLFGTISFNPTYLSRSLADDGLLRPEYAWLINKPRVINNVQEVVIDQVQPMRMSFSRFAGLSYICPQLIQDIHATFPRLQSMRFVGAISFVTAPDTFLASQYSFRHPSTPHIDRLDINLTLPTFSSTPMVHILGAFAQVGTLTLSLGSRLRAVKFPEALTQDPDFTLSLHCCKVSALMLRGVTSETMLRLSRIIPLSVDLDSLVSLSVLDLASPVQKEYINNFIREHASHLHHFAFSTHDDLGRDFALPPSNPGTFPP